MATAHLFVEMVPHHGGTGYYCLLPKETQRPARVPEPDDPREDEQDGQRRFARGLARGVVRIIAAPAPAYCGIICHAHRCTAA